MPTDPLAFFPEQAITHPESLPLDHPDRQERVHPQPPQLYLHCPRCDKPTIIGAAVDIVSDIPPFFGPRNDGDITGLSALWHCRNPLLDEDGEPLIENDRPVICRFEFYQAVNITDGVLTLLDIPLNPLETDEPTMDYGKDNS